VGSLSLSHAAAADRPSTRRTPAAIAAVELHQVLELEQLLEELLAGERRSR